MYALVPREGLANIRAAWRLKLRLRRRSPDSSRRLPIEVERRQTSTDRRIRRGILNPNQCRRAPRTEVGRKLKVITPRITAACFRHESGIDDPNKARRDLLGF